jgi:hypothetical protein
MVTTRKPAQQYWYTPAVGVLIGIVYLIGYSIGGKPGNGVIGLTIMVVFSGAVALVGRRSETVRGLLDRRDERITGIDLRATAFTGLAMIVAVLVGFVVDIARGNSGWPYDMIGAVGGLAYLVGVAILRVRG